MTHGYKSKVLNMLRDRSNLKGTCNECNLRTTCAGCRARAYNLTGDPLSSDPLCSRVCNDGKRKKKSKASASSAIQNLMGM